MKPPGYCGGFFILQYPGLNPLTKHAYANYNVANSSGTRQDNQVNSPRVKWATTLVWGWKQVLGWVQPPLGSQLRGYKLLTPAQHVAG